MASRYCVSTGSWSSTSTWSATSGGASGASVPTLSDEVYINANFTVTISSEAFCSSFTQTNGTVDNKSILNIGSSSSYGGWSVNGTSAKTFNGSGNVVLYGYALNWGGTNYTYDVNNLMRVTINLPHTDPFGEKIGIHTLGKTFTSMHIMLGNGTTEAIEAEIFESPTIKSLTIESKNSLVHSITLSSDISITENFVAIGSSSSNRLLITEDTGRLIRFSNYATSYGKSIEMDVQSTGLTGSAAPPIRTYIGSDSIDSTATWLIANPPLASSIIDPLTTSAASNPNFSVIGGTITQITSGVGGGGYDGTANGRISSVDTYDLYNSSLIVERPVETYDYTNGGVGFGFINLEDSRLYFAIDSIKLNPNEQSNIWRKATSGFFTNLYTYPITSRKFLRMSLGTDKNLVFSSSDDGSSWTTASTYALTDYEVLQCRSMRFEMQFNRFSNATNGGAPVGSINMISSPLANTGAFFQMF